MPTFDGTINVRRFYEATLPVISQLHHQAMAHQSVSSELRTLRERVGTMPAEVVCDLGCGFGDWASVYGPTANRIHLVDLSTSILARAMEYVSFWAPASNVTCRVFDLFSETDWQSLAGFRMYLLAFVVGHATEPQRFGALASLRKVVRSGDRVVLIDSLQPGPLQNTDAVRYVDLDGHTVGAFKHYFFRDEVLALVRQAGFEVASSWWGRRYFLVELSLPLKYTVS